MFRKMVKKHGGVLGVGGLTTTHMRAEDHQIKRLVGNIRVHWRGAAVGPERKRGSSDQIVQRPSNEAL